MLRLALDKQDLQSEVDLCTLLTRRRVPVCPKITVDDEIRYEDLPKPLKGWNRESQNQQYDNHQEHEDLLKLSSSNSCGTCKRHL